MRTDAVVQGTIVQDSVDQRPTPQFLFRAPAPSETIRRRKNPSCSSVKYNERDDEEMMGLGKDEAWRDVMRLAAGPPREAATFAWRLDALEAIARRDDTAGLRRAVEQGTTILYPSPVEVAILAAARKKMLNDAFKPLVSDESIDVFEACRSGRPLDVEGVLAWIRATYVLSKKPSQRMAWCALVACHLINAREGAVKGALSYAERLLAVSRVHEPLLASAVAGVGARLDAIGAAERAQDELENATLEELDECFLALAVLGLPPSRQALRLREAAVRDVVVRCADVARCASGSECRWEMQALLDDLDGDGRSTRRFLTARGALTIFDRLMRRRRLRASLERSASLREAAVVEVLYEATRSRCFLADLPGDLVSELARLTSGDAPLAALRLALDPRAGKGARLLSLETQGGLRDATQAHSRVLGRLEAAAEAKRALHIIGELLIELSMDDNQIKEKVKIVNHTFKDHWLSGGEFLEVCEAHLALQKALSAYDVHAAERAFDRIVSHSKSPPCSMVQRSADFFRNRSKDVMLFCAREAALKNDETSFLRFVGGSTRLRLAWAAKVALERDTLLNVHFTIEDSATRRLSALAGWRELVKPRQQTRESAEALLAEAGALLERAEMTSLARLSRTSDLAADAVAARVLEELEFSKNRPMLWLFLLFLARKGRLSSRQQLVTKLLQTAANRELTEESESACVARGCLAIHAQSRDDDGDDDAAEDEELKATLSGAELRIAHGVRVSWAAILSTKQLTSLLGKGGLFFRHFDGALEFADPTSPDAVGDWLRAGRPKLELHQHGDDKSFLVRRLLNGASFDWPSWINDGTTLPSDSKTVDAAFSAHCKALDDDEDDAPLRYALALRHCARASREFADFQDAAALNVLEAVSKIESKSPQRLEYCLRRALVAYSLASRGPLVKHHFDNVLLLRPKNMSTTLRLALDGRGLEIQRQRKKKKSFVVPLERCSFATDATDARSLLLTVFQGSSSTSEHFLAFPSPALRRSFLRLARRFALLCLRGLLLDEKREDDLSAFEAAFAFLPAPPRPPPPASLSEDSSRRTTTGLIRR